MLATILLSLTSRRMVSVFLSLGLFLTTGNAFADKPIETLQAEHMQSWTELPENEAIALLSSNKKMLHRMSDDNKNTLLHLAINSGRDDLALFLISQPLIDVNAVNLNGDTALHRAIRGGRLDVIKKLLQRKAKLEIANAGGERPIHIVAELGLIDTLQLLIDNRVNLLSRTRSGETPLDIACRLSNLGIVEKLLSAGVKGKIPDPISACLVARALRNYDANALLAVGDKGNDLSAFLDNGLTLLHQALADGDRKTVERLLKAGVPIDSKDRFGRLPIHIAAALSPDLLPYLIKHGAKIDAIDEKGYTPLHFAAGFNATASARILIGSGIDITVQDVSGQTPAHLAAALNAPDTLQLLLKSGADMEARDASGSTALHLASRYDAKEAITVLIQAGADRLATDCEGRTPLHQAALFDYTETARLLLGSPNRSELEPGIIAVDVSDNYGETPLFLAIRMQLPFWENIYPESTSTSCFDLLAGWGAAFNIHNSSEETPLHLLVKSANADMLCSLETLKLPVNEPDGSGNTPLHLCVGLSFKDFSELASKGSYDSWVPKQPQPPCMLWDYDPKVRSSKRRKTEMEQWEIEFMLKKNRLRMLKFLVNHGADASRLNRNGQSPFDLAKNLGDDAVMRILCGLQEE